MKSTSQNDASLDAQRLAKEGLDILRAAKTNAKPLRGLAKNHADDMLSRQIPRGYTIAGIARLLSDLNQADARQEDLEAIGQMFLRYVRSMYDAKRAAEVLPFDQAHLAEEAAEGECDVAEATFRIDPSHPNLLRMERSHIRHRLKYEEQLRSARATLPKPQSQGGLSA